jgi:hypothetical protein
MHFFLLMMSAFLDYGVEETSVSSMAQAFVSSSEQTTSNLF